MASDLVLVANAADATVSTFALDAAGQRLEPLATSAVGRGCSTFVVDEDRDLVYAATKGDADGHGQGVDSFRLDRTTGALTPLGHVDGTGYHYLALAHGGRVLAGAAYHSGEATTWVLDGEGGISDPVAEVAWRNAHAVATRAAHLYVVSLGEDLLAQYLLGDDGRLTPLDPPTVPAPPGSGQRTG
ncbi:MAG TPA: beta-propeller fold lactonase family protein, partial [Phycicoccus elongatus]|nr:beta-propeller fold lactonase family protein [Phycicoccus elongatus]